MAGPPPPRRRTRASALDGAAGAGLGAEVAQGRSRHKAGARVVSGAYLEEGHSSSSTNRTKISNPVVLHGCPSCLPSCLRLSNDLPAIKRARELCLVLIWKKDIALTLGFVGAAVVDLPWRYVSSSTNRTKISNPVVLHGCPSCLPSCLRLSNDVSGSDVYWCCFSCLPSSSRLQLLCQKSKARIQKGMLSRLILSKLEVVEVSSEPEELSFESEPCFFDYR
jgi:hypothetical protein